MFQRRNRNGMEDQDSRFLFIDNRDSIAQLELVDEYEELELVLAHYALAWGAKVDDADGLFTGWGLRPAEGTNVDLQ